MSNADPRCKCTMAKSLTGDGCRYCQPQEYIDRLEEWLEEERGASEWISVEERLPERGVDVLVLGHGGDISVRYIPHYRDGNCAGDDGRSWYPGGWGVGCTTHWMPLPEPPK